MLKERTALIKERFLMFLKKICGDVWSIAVFAYTPVELLVRGCNTLRDRLVYRQDNEALYQRSQYKKMLKKVLSGSDSVFKDKLLTGTSLVSTLALQLISFFTTLAGVTYYFSSISPYAPAAFAFTIQFLFYVLSNFGNGRYHFSLMKKMMLATVFTISLLFSYIGIVNDYAPPLKTFEEKYQSFYNTYDSAYQALVRSYKQELVTPLDQLDLLFQNAGDLSSQTAAQIGDYEARIGELSEVGATMRTGKNRWGFNTYEANPSYERAQAELRQCEAGRDLLTAGKAVIDQCLEDFTGDGVLKEEMEEYMKSGNPSPGMARLNNEFLRFSSAYNQLIPALSLQTYQECGYDLISLADQYRYHMDALALELKSFEQVQADTGMEEDLSNDYLYRLSGRIEDEVNSKYDSFCLTVQELLPQADRKALDRSYQELIPLPDINLLALEKLLPSSGYFRQGIVALFLALLVDGMTVLIPLFTREKHDSCLSDSYLRRGHHADVDILEKILLAISSTLPDAENCPAGSLYPAVMDIPVSDETSVSDGQSGQQEAAATFTDVVVKEERGVRIQRTDRGAKGDVAANTAARRLSSCIQVLAGYFTLFHSSPWTNEKGYSRYLSESSLKAQGSAAYCHLTDVLCSLRFLTVISAYDYQLLVNEARNSPDIYDAAAARESREETIYMMKKNFDLWMSENLASLLELQL